ncbi:MAG: sigma-70 family RNA polymerase sigma factor [Clostridia bacterium]|nr:sigma-70 family RNA polymerase sigma factor [Clostridia bacterium]
MEELVKEAKRGNDTAFSQLITMHKKELYLVARSKLNNEDDIADCIQEAILKSYKNIKQLKDVKSFKFWLLKILINECHRLYKKRGMNEVSIESNEMENVLPVDGKIEENIAFESVIRDLSEEEKTILTLFYVSGYNTKEIGKLLKKNDNTIRVKMMRAKNKLKKKYEGGALYEW